MPPERYDHPPHLDMWPLYVSAGFTAGLVVMLLSTYLYLYIRRRARHHEARVHKEQQPHIIFNFVRV